MPATEETYRSQPILHLVFAISSIAMLLSIVWMVVADHFRPWKQVQREFQKIEREKLKASLEEKLKEQEAKNQRPDRGGRPQDPGGRGECRGAGQPRFASSTGSSTSWAARSQLLDMQRRFKKAELDSKRSLYDGMIDRNEEAAARAYLASVVSGAEPQLDELSTELEKAEKERRRPRPRRKTCSTTWPTWRRRRSG